MFQLILNPIRDWNIKDSVEGSDTPSQGSN